jgi:bifunctional non-homologous end joining protein LigD
VVAFDEDGRPSFNQLQNHRKGSLLYYYAFDILTHRGKSLLKMPWQDRRAILEHALPSHPLLLLSASLESDAKTVIKAISEMKLEGVVAKRRTSCYEPGKRTGAWIKHRLHSGQEFVIGGFTPGAHGIDAIVIGYYEGDKLIFVARTRNGFVPSTRRALYARLKPLITKTCPFANLPEPRSYRWGEGMTAEKMAECVWVKPEVVVQVNFVNWTDANHLRHSTFIGIRDDKAPRDVVKEHAGES